MRLGQTPALRLPLNAIALVNTEQNFKFQSTQQWALSVPLSSPCPPGFWYLPSDRLNLVIHYCCLDATTKEASKCVLSPEHNIYVRAFSLQEMVLRAMHDRGCLRGGANKPLQKREGFTWRSTYSTTSLICTADPASAFIK